MGIKRWLLQTTNEFISKARAVDNLIIILGFMIGPNLFMYLKSAGLEDLTSLGFPPGNLRYIVPSVSGFLIGTILLYLEHFVLGKYERAWPNALNIFLRLLIATVVIVIVVVVVQVALDCVLYNIPMRTALQDAFRFIYSDLFFSIYIFLIILSVFLNFVTQIGRWLGYSVIFDYLTGKFREPREEERVFMFLDLNDSTKIAESLGHLEYSRLLMSCFNILQPLIGKYKAEVYQYVGDEVVLTWSLSKLKQAPDFLSLFFEFNESLQSLRSQHGAACVPIAFKASVHGGKVALSTIRGERIDLVYHGDVLNTAARMLERCKNVNRNILVSAFVTQIPAVQRIFKFSWIEDLMLRGKSEPSAIFSIEAGG
jgi:adenylate cyclase